MSKILISCKRYYDIDEEYKKLKDIDTLLFNLIYHGKYDNIILTDIKDNNIIEIISKEIHRQIEKTNSLDQEVKIAFAFHDKKIKWYYKDETFN